MSEKLAFDELRRQTGAVDFQIRRVPARAKLMNQPREVVLPGAAFPGDEKRRRRHRHFFGKLQQARRGRVFRDPRQTPSGQDRKSTRLNSSHGYISYAVFCLKTMTAP